MLEPRVRALNMNTLEDGKKTSLLLSSQVQARQALGRMMDGLAGFDSPISLSGLEDALIDSNLEDLGADGSSVATSQVTAFLIEQGVLSPPPRAAAVDIIHEAQVEESLIAQDNGDRHEFRDQALEGDLAADLEGRELSEQSTHVGGDPAVAEAKALTVDTRLQGLEGKGGDERPLSASRRSTFEDKLGDSPPSPIPPQRDLEEQHSLRTPSTSSSSSRSSLAEDKAGAIAGEYRGGADVSGVRSPPSPISSLGLGSPQRTNTRNERVFVDREGEEWGAINRLLRQEGFRAVGTGDAMDVLDVLKQILTDNRERGERIKALVLDRQRHDNAQRAVEDRLCGAERAKDDINDSLITAESRVKELEHDLEAIRRSLGDKVKEAKSRVNNLSAQLKQSEHRVKMKEAQIQRMLDKFETMVQKEQREKERERAAVRKLQESRVSRRGVADAKLLDIIGAMETARLRSTEEVKDLRDEVKCLNEMVKEKENYIMRNETSGAWRAASARHGGAGEYGLQALREKCIELERTLKHSRHREEAQAKKFEVLENENAVYKARVDKLEGEKMNLMLELKSRPTVRAWKTSQRRIEELEEQLHKAVEDAREASDIRELRRYMGVGELIKRDRANYRLGLDKMDALPREVMKEILKEVCRTLELSDVAEAAPAVERMAKVMTTLPRLERFVKDICVFVARKAQGEYLPDGTPLQGDEVFRRLTMEEVLPLIKGWWDELFTLRSLKSFRTRLVTRLSQRFDAESLSPNHNHFQAATDNAERQQAAAAAIMASDDQLLDAVSQLIAFEKRLMQSGAAHSQAEALLSAKPEVLVNRIVQHLRYLFGIKTLDGVFPKLNEVYLFTSEMENMCRVLKAMLGLPPNATNNTLLAALQTAIRRSRGQPTTAAEGGANDSLLESSSVVSSLMSSPVRVAKRPGGVEVFV